MPGKHSPYSNSPNHRSDRAEHHANHYIYTMLLLLKEASTHNCKTATRNED